MGEQKSNDSSFCSWASWFWAADIQPDLNPKPSLESVNFHEHLVVCNFGVVYLSIFPKINFRTFGKMVRKNIFVKVLEIFDGVLLPFLIDSNSKAGLANGV